MATNTDFLTMPLYKVPEKLCMEQIAYKLSSRDMLQFGVALGYSMNEVEDIPANFQPGVAGSGRNRLMHLVKMVRESDRFTIKDIYDALCTLDLGAIAENFIQAVEDYLSQPRDEAPKKEDAEQSVPDLKLETKLAAMYPSPVTITKTVAQSSLCPKHAKRRLQFFCMETQCQMLVCFTCYKTDHKDHEVIEDLNEIVEEKALDCEKKVEENLKKLFHQKEILEKQSKQMHKNASEKLNEYEKQIQSLKNTIMKNLMINTESAMKEINTEINKQVIIRDHIQSLKEHDQSDIETISSDFIRLEDIKPNETSINNWNFTSHIHSLTFNDLDLSPLVESFVQPTVMHTGKENSIGETTLAASQDKEDVGTGTKVKSVTGNQPDTAPTGAPVKKKKVPTATLR